MTGVLGMSELLLGTDLDDRQRDYAKAIHQSGQLLLRLVNDSLDMARIDAGKFTLDDQPLDPAALAREVMALQQPLAQRKSLAMTLAVADDVPTLVWGDELRIKQILLNLVNNALKFTDRGAITLRLAVVNGSHLRFQVADTGSGMSPEVCARLFNRFEQADGVMRRHGGSGLGLAICRELAVLMGGSISVASTLGEGSVFDVDLPICAATAVPPKDDGAIAAAPLPAAPGALDVLMVEDDATVAAVIAGLLARLGHRATHAGNGLARAGRIEVVPLRPGPARPRSARHRRPATRADDPQQRQQQRRAAVDRGHRALGRRRGGRGARGRHGRSAAQAGDDRVARQRDRGRDGGARRRQRAGAGLNVAEAPMPHRLVDGRGCAAPGLSRRGG